MKKNVLLVISFCLTILLYCQTAIAQAPTGVFAKATVAPQIDGVIDAVWADATAYNIDKPMKNETPSLGASGETTWKAMWNNEGVYILLNVTDDVFFPNWAVTPAGNNWEYDKPEIYFDVNTVLGDGFGPGTASPNNKGHYQVAPGFPQGKVDGTLNTQSDGITYAFLVTGNNYVAEYFVPFSKFLDKDGKQVKMNATMGFEVQLIDRDVATVTKSRAVWANTNASGAGESYTNMNACGTVTLQGGDAFVYATGLTLSTGGTITTDNGTLQMVSTFEPANADNQTIKWSVVSGTGMATISSTGLLTGVANGTVTVKAATTDGSMLTASTEVVISGQKINKNEVWSGLNQIKNWNFDTNLTSWSNWVDGNSQVAPAVVDGVCVMKVNKATDGAAWHYQFNQSGLTAAANVAYTLKFKSWANVDNTPCSVDFEDIAANGNKRYGTSTDANAVGGASEWKYNVGTAPQWFTYHVVFDKMVASTVQKLQWMNSLSLATISLDSVLLIKDEYLLVPVDKITLNTEGTITTNRGTLQMLATVEPANANNQKLTWSVSPAGIATINADGLLSAVSNGTVTVKAVAQDGSLVEATTDVVITNQVAVKDLWNSSFNLIKNWNFDTDMTSWGGWVDGTPAGMVKPTVVDGVAVMKVAKSADAWHYQHSQSPLTAEANVAYTLKFKSWATADNIPCAVDFESGSAITPAKGGDQYARYGATTDPESSDLRSEWHYNVGTAPKWFTFHVTFDKMIPTTIQKIQWMLSLSNETISLDSVLLVKDEYLNLEVAPVANAGADQSVDEGATVTLDASASSAPGENALTYRWVAPAGVTLSSTTVANPTFTAPEVTADKTYTLTLVVGYGTVKPVADQVVVTVKQVNKVPVANAGADQSVDEGATVTLDASASADADKTALTYLWTAPEGITLSSATEAKPTFTAPEVTADKTYTFTLVVNDGTVNSIIDEVVVTVKQVDKAPYVKEQIATIEVFVGDPAKVIDLTKIFADDDACDVLTYSIVNSNDKAVSALIEGTNMTLSFKSGTSVMEVTATSNGKSVKVTFNIHVILWDGIQAMGDDASMQVYPNPTRGRTELKLSHVAKAGTMITVYNYAGQVIYKTVTANMNTTIDLSGNPAGMYFIKVGQKTYKLVVE